MTLLLLVFAFTFWVLWERGEHELVAVRADGTGGVFLPRRH